MKSETFYQALGDINEEYVAQAHADRAGAKKPSWRRWGAVAACLCLAAVLAGRLLPGHDSRILINEYERNDESCYIVPAPGEYFCFNEVNAAREHYAGKDVAYLLGFELFGEGTLTREEKAAEYQRLVEQGYSLYEVESWTYVGKGEKQPYTIIVGAFTEEELANFQPNPKYGYAFHFVTNGDGDAITVEEKNLISEFETNYS